ncbi:YgfZ/GcvT domain-containing protein [Salinarimonas sp.]|uniref:CAF17-like 4Fe-4S cluster assembly/insertion protein YgfZ n=1 Tax=Salinarimonas sp. TaxID=2766526 RepID=UPI00391B73DA
MPVARLADRAVIEVAGADAARFLDGLATSAIGMTPPTPRFAGLLTPQGKILFDFIAFPLAETSEPSFLLDCAAAQAEALTKRLTFYRLRAKVAIAPREDLAVLAGWDGAAIPGSARVGATDPRLSALGWRAIVEASEAEALADASAEAYHAHRIALGVPEGGRDFLFGEAFPHEALMDQLGGVDFGKGCYVGQEVVSRMQHRGTARTRILPATYADALAPEVGVDVLAGERVIGRTGSAANGRGLVMVRLDRIADALAEGLPIVAGGRPLRVARPPFAAFETPGIGAD